MMTTRLPYSAVTAAILGSFLLVSSCQSGGAGNATAAESVAAVETHDEVLRAELLDAVKSLSGEWESDGGSSVFQVSSAGSAVRQLMFPGEEFEMTNMYTLDGNGLLMTHYCGAGNQPHMRATSIEADRLVFEKAGVSDLDSGDASYMGAMTLVFLDDDHYEEHWSGITLDGAEDPAHSMVFTYTRVK